MNLLTKAQHMSLAAFIMAVSIMLSRIMGLLRDKVISWQFGATSEADLYFAAFVVPDFINYLLAGGYVSITLIPLLSKSFEEDSKDAWQFFSTVFCWAILAVGILTLGAWILAKPLAELVAPGFSQEQVERLAFFLRIILPAQVFFVSGACFSALLYLRKQFFVPALTPLIYNGCIILLGVSLPFMNLATGMEGFCYGVTLGAGLGAWVLPALAAKQHGLYIKISWRHRYMKRFLLIALPLMIGQSVVMLNEQFLRVFGSLAGEGVVSLLSYARRISQVPVGMIGAAIAVASYPFLASLAAKKDLHTFNQTLRTAMTSSIALLLPISAWMIAAALPTMGFIFEGGDFSQTDTLNSTPLLQVMLLAVPLWAVQMVLGRGFYAHGDTITTALYGTIITILSLPLFYLSVSWGAMGIALVSIGGVVAYIIVIAIIWRKRYGTEAFAGLGRIIICGAVISTLAGLVAFAITQWSLAWANFLPSVWPYVVALILSFMGFVVVYIPLAWKTSPEFIRPLWAKIKRER